MFAKIMESKMFWFVVAVAAVAYGLWKLLKLVNRG